jgi:uncharacterized membrane protein YdjX (TVP38/TMEM64 family)
MPDRPSSPALTTRNALLLLAAAAACVALALSYRQIDIPALHERARHLNGFVVFALITVLPLVGFPVTVTQVIAGLRFGFIRGFLLVAVSIVLQLLVSYALVALAPKFFAARVEPLRRRLPETAHTSLTVFTMLLPGVPYWAQNYVLPIVGVPLRTYLLWGATIHIARSAASIVFGGLSDHLTPLRLGGFAVYTLTVALACALAFRRLRAHIRAQREAENQSSSTT